jgi:hypothetical protein
MGFLRGRTMKKTGYLLERDPIECESGGNSGCMVVRCASPVFCMMRGCAHMWTRITVADLSVWDMDFPDLRLEGEIFVGFFAGSLRVSHAEAFWDAYRNTRPWLFSVPGRLVEWSYLIRQSHKSAQVSSLLAGLHLGRYLARASLLLLVEWWRFAATPRQNSLPFFFAGRDAQTGKTGSGDRQQKSFGDPLCDGRAVFGCANLAGDGAGDGVCRDAVLRSWPEAGVVGDSVLSISLDNCVRWRLLFSARWRPRSAQQ